MYKNQFSLYHYEVLNVDSKTIQVHHVTKENSKKMKWSDLQNKLYNITCAMMSFL